MNLCISIDNKEYMVDCDISGSYRPARTIFNPKTGDFIGADPAEGPEIDINSVN